MVSNCAHTNASRSSYVSYPRIGMKLSNSSNSLDLCTARVKGIERGKEVVDHTVDDIPDTTVPFAEANRALRMVDTVRLRFYTRLKVPIHGVLKKDTKEVKPGVFITLYKGFLTSASGAMISIKYQTENRKISPQLSLTFSVPKVVQGNNIDEIPEGTDIIARLNKELRFVFVKLGMNPLDLARGEYMRLDIAHNFRVGTYVFEYLQYLDTQNYPRRDRHSYRNRPKRPTQNIEVRDNGVCFYSSAVQLEFYAKGLESGIPRADELLREEIQYKKPKAVRAFLGNPHPKVIDLPESDCVFVLQRDLDLLGLSSPIPIKSKVAEPLKGLPYSKRMRMLAMIEYENDYPGLSSEDLAVVMGTTRKTVDKNRKELRESKISWTKGMVDLPALSLCGTTTVSQSAPTSITISDVEELATAPNGYKDSCNTLQEVDGCASDNGMFVAAENDLNQSVPREMMDMLIEHKSLADLEDPVYSEESMSECDKLIYSATGKSLSTNDDPLGMPSMIALPNPKLSRDRTTENGGGLITLMKSVIRNVTSKAEWWGIWSSLTFKTFSSEIVSIFSPQIGLSLTRS